MPQDTDISAELVKALAAPLISGGTGYLTGWYPVLGLQVLPDPIPWVISALAGCAIAFTVRPKTSKTQMIAFRRSVVVFLLTLTLYVAYKEADYFNPWLALLDLVITAGLFCSLTLVVGLGSREYRRWKGSHR